MSHDAQPRSGRLYWRITDQSPESAAEFVQASNLDQRLALIAWAAQRGIRSFDLSAVEFLKAGSEHSVYLDRPSNRVIKLTRPGKFGRSPVTEGLGGTPLQYLERLDWQNRLFMDDIRIEGVVGEITSMRTVISQPYLLGTQNVTVEEVNRYFEVHHFIRYQWRDETPWFIPPDAQYSRERRTSL
jgi:hypothetical protein